MHKNKEGKTTRMQKNKDKKKKNILSEKSLQKQLKEQKLLLGQDLSSEQRDIIDCFEKPRMILQRIYIIYNQTRQTMGVELIKEKEIRSLLGDLEEKGYIEIQKFTYQGVEKEAFILTDKGKQMLE